MATKKDPRAPCRPNHPPTLHERLIRQLIESDERMCRNGFWAAVRTIMAEEDIDEEDIMVGGFMPDAYLIDRENKYIDIYEVEVTSHLSEAKQTALGMFWFYWDCEMCDWEPRLFVVDRYGNRNILEMAGLYIGVLAKHLPSERPSA